MSILIVGAGFAGAVYARTLAEHGHSVTVIDSRDHVGGNAFDYVDDAGVRVHKYGPHLFHTNNERVVDWIKRFSEFVVYEHTVSVACGTKFLPLPISRATFEAYYNRRFGSSLELECFVREIVIEADNPRNAAEFLYSKIGIDLTELLFRPYTLKMWGQELESLDEKVVRRLSINFDYEYRYFPNDLFQILPKHGYTRLFENILDHSHIDLSLRTPYADVDACHYDHIFTSAAIDEHFEYRFGELPYRSIRFFNEALPAHRANLPTPVVNFSDDGSFTRQTDWHMLPEHHVRETGLRTRTLEQPCDFRENNLQRYYPINDAAGLNRGIYEKYRAHALKEPNIDFIGRCGTYQYLDMHQVISQSLTGAHKWLQQHSRVSSVAAL